MHERISKDYFDHVRGLNWNNVHSKYLQARLGDPDIVVAWDRMARHEKWTEPGAWVLAQMRPRLLAEKTGRRETCSVYHLPVIFQQWRDGRTGAPLDPRDARLVEHLQRSRHGDLLGELDRVQQAKAESQRREMDAYWHAAASDLWPMFARG